MRKFGTVAVVGTGLIGASFALAMRAADACERIVGFDSSPSKLETVLSLGMVNEVSSDFRELARAGLVLLAVPSGQTGRVLSSMKPHLSPGVCVTDAGSSKAGVVAAARAALGDGYRRFVAAHPLAGSVERGPGQASPGLFRGRKAILTPSRETDRDAFEAAEAAWTAVGCDVVVMRAKEHDRVYASVSHLPHVLAFSLMRSVLDAPDSARMLELCGSGFLDATRLASSSPSMWADVCVENSEEIARAVELFSESLDEMRDAISRKDYGALLSMLSSAGEARDGLRGGAD